MKTEALKQALLLSQLAHTALRAAKADNEDLDPEYGEYQQAADALGRLVEKADVFVRSIENVLELT